MSGRRWVECRQSERSRPIRCAARKAAAGQASHHGPAAESGVLRRDPTARRREQAASATSRPGRRHGARSQRHRAIVLSPNRQGPGSGHGVHAPEGLRQAIRQPRGSRAESPTVRIVQRRNELPRRFPVEAGDRPWPPRPNPAEWPPPGAGGRRCRARRIRLRLAYRLARPCRRDRRRNAAGSRRQGEG